MPRGVQRARLDRNHKEIVEALRAAGMSVVSLAAVGNGCPDIAVGYRGMTFLFEIKFGKNSRTQAQQKFFNEWGGHVLCVHSAEDAISSVLTWFCG